MLALVATGTSAACSTRSAAHKSDDKTYAPGHPCYGKSNCDWYLRLPDGGVAPAPPSGQPRDAGTLAICGPCNG